jgi:hypothetical protein
MKKVWFVFFFMAHLGQASAQNVITIMEGVVFHDGYAKLVSSPEPPAGIIKHRNDLFARKLSKAELNSIGNTLEMRVTISALCDNYDRIGNVNMAFVPVGSTTYDPKTTKTIELGRFITPFMNKNIEPTSVPYVFDIPNVAMLLKDTAITNNFDIWVELSVFGVPYAANKEVVGCAGRNDVFMGKLEFVTNVPAPVQNSNFLLPLFFNNNFNNYQSSATDTLGQTIKTINFEVPINLSEATLFLITSNHGANSGGEEYNRRLHYAYFDNELKLTYRPGRMSCEPFRKYNTQANGIYGPTPRNPSQWQSFSNWCPGDVIDIREIHLGEVKAGTHSFTITVPDAVFNQREGNIPLSLYFHGTTKTRTVLSVSDDAEAENLVSIYPVPSRGKFTVELLTDGALITVTDLLGKEIIKTQTQQRITQLELVENGTYFVSVTTNQGKVTRKLIINN